MGEFRDLYIGDLRRFDDVMQWILMGDFVVFRARIWCCAGLLFWSEGCERD